MTDYSELLAVFGIYVAILGVAYLCFAAALTAIATKTATPGAWMAWIPLFNLVLMCRIARKSAAWVLLMFIPLVNIVAFAVIWMGIAKARGRSPALGLLILLPLINLVVLFLLATGPSSVAAQLAVCPACGRPECLTSSFCGYTGQPIPAMPAPAPAPASGGRWAAILVGLLLAVGGVFVLLGLYKSGRGFTGGAASASLPRRQSGRLTEFPVDNAAQPARPANVATRALRAGTPGPPAASLPRGVSTAALARIGGTITTATYRAAPSDPPVNVHVLDKDPGVGPQSATIAQASATASASIGPIRLESPAGEVYAGFKVQGRDGVTIVLDKESADILIILHAADPAAQPTLERLAANVGNGDGLLDDPGIGPTLLQEAAALPAGIELLQAETFAGAAIQDYLVGLRREASVSLGPDVSAWIDNAGMLLPPRIVSSSYRDNARQEFHSVVGHYGSGWKAWSAWALIQSTAGLSGSAKVEFPNGDAIFVRQSDRDFVLFRRGDCLGVVEGPARQSSRIAGIANALAPP